MAESAGSGGHGPEVARATKHVTLVAVNELKKEHFHIEVTLEKTAAAFLIGMLEEAAQEDPRFRFTATYGQYGYYIDAINNTFGKYADDKSYWQILGNDSEPLSEGVSSYRPRNGDTITFKLVKDVACENICKMNMCLIV